MSFKSRFSAKAAIIALVVLVPLAPAQAGQLFPPADLAAQGTPNVACPNGKVLTWGMLLSNPTDPVVMCADPTPGVTVTCPAGQVLTGITNGKPVCTATNSSPAGFSFTATDGHTYTVPTEVTCGGPTTSSAVLGFGPNVPGWMYWSPLTFDDAFEDNTGNIFLQYTWGTMGTLGQAALYNVKAAKWAPLFHDPIYPQPEYPSNFSTNCPSTIPVTFAAYPS